MDLAQALLSLLRPLTRVWSSQDLDDRRRDQDKWEVLRGRLTEDELRELDYRTELARSVPVTLMTRVRNFAEDLDEDYEEVRFSPRTEKRLKKPKERFLKAYRAYRDFVQVPFWEHLHTDNWEFQKQYLIDQDYDYGEHLQLACEQIDEMKAAYREMYDLVHRE